MEWSVPALNPRTDVMVAPAVDWCGTFKKDDEPRFIALDESDGKVVYRFNCGGSITGGVISYAVDGKQYVAVVSGMAAGFWQAQPGSMTLTVFALP